MTPLRHIRGAALGLAVMLTSLGAVAGQDNVPAADETVSAYSLADVLLANDDAAAACALIEHVYGADTDDLGALLRLANCSLAQQKPHEGLTFLQRASVVDPDNAALQEQMLILEAAIGLADLSVAVQEQARLEAALAALPSPAAVPPPPRLAAIPQPPAPELVQVAEPDLPPPQFSGNASLQRFYNSNVNGGTYNNSFIGFGLPLVVLPGAKETADWGTRIGVDGSVLVPLDWRNAVQLDAGLSGTLYDVQSSYSRLDAMLAGGWITGTNQMGAVLRPHADLSWVNGLYDRLALGLEASGHLQLAPATTLVGSVDVSHRWQAEASHTGWLVGGSIGIRQVVADGVTIGGNLVAERVAATGTAQSYWRMGPELYVNAVLTDRLGLNLNAGVDFVGFDGSLPIFPTARTDMRYRAGASLNWALPDIAEGLSLRASYSYALQHSNQGLYDTSRHLATLALGYAF